MSRPTHYVEYKKRTIPAVLTVSVLLLFFAWFNLTILLEIVSDSFLYFTFVCLESLVCYIVYILPIFKTKRLYPVTWTTELKTDDFDVESNGDYPDSEYMGDFSSYKSQYELNPDIFKGEEEE